jgi:DnaB-like helicase N terminal domain
VSQSDTSPHDLHAEKALLGAVLVNNEALVTAERIVQPSDFFRDAHCELFRQMPALAGESQAIDITHPGTRSALIVWSAWASTPRPRRTFQETERMMLPPDRGEQ